MNTHLRLIAVGLILAASPARPGAPASGGTEEEILEAVFREQMRNYMAYEDKDAVVCLQAHDGRRALDPSPEFLARFRGLTVRKASACTSDPRGAYETATRHPAIFLQAGPIRWEAEDEALV